MQSVVIRGIALGVDILALSFVLGATAWFFFIQSPLLFKTVVRETMVPIQMRLARTLFTALFVALLVLAVAAALLEATLTTLPFVASAFALLAGGLNRFVIFPRALRAGGTSHHDHEAHGERGTGLQFISDGAGESATRLHRTVVAFVLLMVAGLVAHVIGLVLLAVGPG